MKNLRHASLRMIFVNMYLKFQKTFYGTLNEISLFKKYKKKSDFSNLPCLISHLKANIFTQVIFILFIPLSRV